MRTSRILDRAAIAIAAAAIGSFGFLIADVVRRASGREYPVIEHLAGSVGLYLLVAPVVGAVVALSTTGIGAAVRRMLSRRKKLAAWVEATVYAGAAAAFAAPTVLWTFTGQRAQKLPKWVPAAGIGGVFVAVLVAALIYSWAWRRAGRGRGAWPVVLSLVGVALGAGLATVDLTVFVALYARLHALLEAVVAVLWLAAVALVLNVWVAARPRGRRVLRVFSALATLWLIVFAALPPLRATVDHSLHHVWLEPAYVGRTFARVQTARAFASDPLHWQGAAMSRMDQLKDRYDLANTSQSPEWDKPLTEPPAFASKIAEIRGDRRDMNIVVFYVDTLRFDAASDPAIMPNAVDFGTHSLHFTSAYASGSDTMRSLPGLTSGSYEIEAEHPNDLLLVARRAKMKRAITLAQSAHEFLAKLRPSFKFDDTLTVPDYAAGRTDVWGYGADQPTAEPMVDKALDWMKSHKDERFLMWLFNFDQHNWRELNAEFVNAAAKKYGVPDEAPLNWRYRVVARSVDAQFGRMLRGLRDLGLADDTIVVFVSDHGEALGRDGFWVHSIFLWECLERVPLMIRIPGVEPKVVYDHVSLVDLAPTLARYMEDKPSMAGYHGEDLLGYLVPNRPPRRLPLLMAGASHDTLLRIGLMTPKSPYKLVLPLETAVPELYDTTEKDPDWISVADREPGVTLDMLSQLVRSPLFPRKQHDLTPADDGQSRAQAP
ncbi:MAG: sulfatase-like hydrolase/transferase [Myxococcales bacterium]|nr:sulfatase-like hydrolase/transferase [Myxococcales bacterium]